ncbi:MAG: ABC transporter permease subunit [Ruminococcaceae bacterium]|nr:ABC transporter permease subunit [Oscillospiraceae bacterium]
MKSKLFRIARFTLIILFWLGIWAFAAHRMGKPLLFPSPIAVLKRLGELLQTADFYRTTLNSLWNVLAGILIAMLLGTSLSVLTAKISLLRDLVLPIMTIIKTTPVASFIILALIWIGSAKVPTFITVLIVLPIIWTNLDVGFSKIDPQLTEVAKVYRFSPWKRLRILTLPSLKPYFVSACRTSIGLAWKAGIAAEIIAKPLGTIGVMIDDAKNYIMTTDMFAWTLTVILLSLLIEFAFSALLKRLEKKKQESEETRC